MRARLLWLLAVAPVAFVLASGHTPADEPTDKAKEGTALQKRAEAFVETFNKGDAKAAAAFFVADGDMVDVEGHHLKGRKAIEESYKQFFADSKGAKLYVTITSLRIAKPDLALEDGLTEVVFANGAPPSAARYTVVWVKQDGQWFLESVREAVAMPPNNTEELQDIAFLIGNWVEDVEKGGSSKASYSWDAHQNFMLNTFDIAMKDISVAGGIQWIGWDAEMKKPRAWSFLFHGGFSESVWNKDGDNKWKIAITGKQRDGKKVTATNLLTKIDGEHISVRFVNRTLDGKPLADADAVKFKRVR
jgi:uncharacterized protein (TIGR02246 family)